MVEEKGGSVVEKGRAGVLCGTSHYDWPQLITTRKDHPWLSYDKDARADS